MFSSLYSTLPISTLYLEGSGEIDMLDQTHEYWVGVLRELMVEACNQLRQVQVTFGICGKCVFATADYQMR